MNEEDSTNCKACRSALVLEALPAEEPAVPSSGFEAIPSELLQRVDEPRWRFGPALKDGAQRYVLAERLGVGGMGVVWKAWDLHLRKFVAIKLVQGAYDESDVKKFIREGRVVAALEHPNIAQVYDIGEHEEQPYIVMQLVDGQHLGQAALKDPSEIARVAYDAARALRFAHSRSVVHQDVTPENIMLSRAKGDEGRVLILDFGVAMLQKGTLQRMLTVRGQGIGGKPAYMSPEQAAGRLKDIDARTDVYSLGATVYAVLAGRAPFEGESVQEILHKVVQEEPEPLEKLRPDCPKDLLRIVGKAMARDREKRYASMGEFADDLRLFLNISGTSLEPVAPPRPPRRLRPWIAAAAALLLVAGAGVAVWKKWIPVPGKDGRPYREAMERGARHAAAEEWERAKEAYAEALRLKPGDAEAAAKLRGAEKEIDYRRAVSAAEEAEKAGDWEAAKKRWEEALALKPGSEGKLRAVEREIAYREAMKRAEERERAGDWEQAARHYRDALKEKPDDAQAGERLRAAEAESAYRDAMTLGRRREEVEDWPKAKAAYEEALRAKPADPEATGSLRRVENEIRYAEAFARGREKERQGDAEGAIAAYREALQAKPGDPAASARLRTIEGDVAYRKAMERGRGHETALRWTEARDAYEEALRHRPGDADATARLKVAKLEVDYADAMYKGRNDHYAKKYHEAIAWFEKAAGLKPQSAEPYEWHGYALTWLGRWGEAVQKYTEALRWRSDDWSLLQSRGEAYIWTKEYDKAIADLDRSIQLNSKSARSYNARGAAWSWKNDWDRAERDYDKAIEVDPTYAMAYRNRGLCRKSKDARGALADFRKYLELEPNGQYADEVRKWIRELGG